MSKVTKRESVRKLEPRTKLLRCKLTRDELIRFGGELAQSLQDIVTEAALQASMKQSMKAALASLEAKSSELSTKVARGEELRDVEIEPRLDFITGKYYEIRDDTGEKINVRPITDDERQEFFQFDKKPEPKKQPPKKTSPSKDDKKPTASARA